MPKFLASVLFFALATLASGAAFGFLTANDDPIWSNVGAQAVCPDRCANEGGIFTGAWWTTVVGQHSVCVCDAVFDSLPKDLTDLWWNPNESGWGANLVQTGSFVFVTIYAYGSDGKPTWFAGGLERTGAGTFAGKLYASTGPYFGGPFDPAAVAVRQVGTMTFVATNYFTGQFTYSVDGVPVTKNVQRQPLPLDNYNGTYESVETLQVSNCTDPAGNGDFTKRNTILITQNGTAMTITFGTLGVPGGSCTATGAYSQLGGMGRFVGQYACQWNEIGTYALSQMNNSSYRQFSARVSKSSSNLGCESVGQTTGLIEYP